ncbi:SigE family RNA polymerase sigma factor [Streptomyces sp. LP05-1]|uniref:SigE family RNA polymerase sigma factor n=1 Tax=Streptomyces pyxinae TaxID=2970734 RepID=A0ABT2CH48_9ACTN|nr:SigE family RNA polymerase sigma factor [Streptomyces sp. LP05-1]MCS0636726.1 SigE family RNA polymerase sigma factor [Streptomyces sp. LP05-1]
MKQSRADGFLEFATGRTGHLFRSAVLLTSGDVHLAEDLVQETLRRMYVVWGGRRRIDNPAAYAQTVLIREFLTHRRRRSSSEHPLAELPDTPQRQAVSPEVRISLLQALGELAPKDRAVVVLRYWEDRSVEETAAAMSVSTAAVRTRSTRALAKLRAALGADLADLVAP